MAKKHKKAKKLLAGSLAVAMITNNVAPTVTLANAVEDGADESVLQVVEDVITGQVQSETNAEENPVTEETVETPKREVVEEQSKEPTQPQAVEKEEAKEEVKQEEVKEEAVETVTTEAPVDVKDYASLQEAVNKDNAVVNIIGNIDLALDQKIEVYGNNVTINGGNKVIDLNETGSEKNKFMIRGKNVTIKDLSIENYTTTGLYVYKTTGLTVKDVYFDGRDNNTSQVGIDLDGSTATIGGIHTKNNKYSGIRLRYKSNVTFDDKNSHTNDFKELELVGEGNAINHESTVQYAEMGKSEDGNKEFYNTITKEDVYNYNQLKEAIKKPNTIINLRDNITLEGNLEIKSGRLAINGAGFNIDCQDKYKVTISDIKVGMDDIVFTNYTSGAVSISNTNQIEITNVKFIGNHPSLPNNQRSTYGLEVYNSTVAIENIESENHLYRGIQVRKGSTLNVKSENKHTNDKVDMQVIQQDGEKESVVNDPNGFYLAGEPLVDKNKVSTTDYFVKRLVDVSTPEDFKNNIGVSGSVLELKGDITFSKDDIPEGQERLELIVGSNVVVNGNGASLDLGGSASITFKGNNIEMNDITVKNSVESGIQIYNSKNVTIEGSKFVNSSNYGLIVNGSAVTLKDVFTGYNKDGGILITRSRTLDKENHSDSKVIIEGGITHVESNINVEVLNLQMVTTDHFQNNQFIAPKEIYVEHVNDPEYKVLSQTYLDHFGFTTEEEKNRKYKEQSIDYMIHQTQLDVTTQEIVKDDKGNPIHLVGDGETDNTENLIALFKYAAEYGVKLFFPEGVYKITEDINLEEIDLPALSNFTVVGEEGKLSVIDGSSELDKMLKIKNAGYHAEMNYVTFENMVFNNVGLEFNGVYKRGVTMKNNVFMNGRYTKEFDSEGKLYKATMTPYVISNNSKYVIEGNVFLRGKGFPGRGISTYRTKNSTIKDNFFGDLGALDHASKMLPQKVISKAQLVKTTFAKSKNLNVNGEQGNFFTAINNERYDTNVTITNNYFKLEESRYISSDFGKTVLVSGINVPKEGQRRDHIIYSKGYDGLNIYGNYFEGMKNDASGGIKIRNGKNAYIGSNHLKNVPVLTYIYGDLTKADNTLENTIIYNNIFHESRDFGGEGTGILYYQSFRDGETVKYQDETVADERGNVKNFVIYKNQFVGNDKSEITISNRPAEALKNGEFIAYGNVYYEKNDVSVSYDKGNVKLEESTEVKAEAGAKANSYYDQFKDAEIPLMNPVVDFHDLDKVVSEAEAFYDQAVNDELTASMVDPELVKELKGLLDEVKELKQQGNATQWQVNDLCDLILEKTAGVPVVRPDDNPNVDLDNPNGGDITSPPNYDVEDDMMVDTDKLPSKPNYDVEDDMMGVIAPSLPNYDVEDDMMGVITPSKPNYDVDDNMGVVPDGGAVEDDDSSTDEPSADNPVTNPEEVKPEEEDNPSTDSMNPETDKENTTGSKPGSSNEDDEPSVDNDSEQKLAVNAPSTGSNPSTDGTNNPSNNNGGNNTETSNGMVGNGGIIEKAEGEILEGKCEEDQSLLGLLPALASGLFAGLLAWFLVFFFKRKKHEEEQEENTTT